MKLKTLLLLIILISGELVIAQTNDTIQKKNLDNGSIAEQFDYVIENSNKYQVYRVIKRDWMYSLKKHVKDTLKGFHSEISLLRKEIVSKDSNVRGLENELKSVNANLNSVSSEKDNIQFMGQAITKSKYKLMMWSLTGILSLLFLIFLFRFKASNTITKTVKQDLSELTEDFSKHRKSALEKQQELSRKLQDELNKVR